MYTKYPKPGETERAWLLIDLEGKTLGRAASQIASLLRGKHKTTFSPHVDVGDFVVCINADKVKLTGRKLEQKGYHYFTGYIGNMRSETAGELMARQPQDVIRLAVKRMLPSGTLGRSTLNKLKIYAGAEHPHAAQNPTAFELVS